MEMKAGIALLTVLIALPSTTRGASSENLNTTCQDSMVMEGKEGQIQYFLRPTINLETDPDVMFFIRKQSTTGDILICDQNAQQSGLTCYAFDHRFRLGELARHQLTLNIANATVDLQGRYELHIVANGVFEPATSCNLTVQRKGGAKPENDNTKFIAVWIGIAVFLAIIAIIIPIIVLRKHRNRKSVTEGAENMLNESRNLLCDQQHGQTDDKQRLVSQKMSKTEESKLLRSKPPGSFLIRQSERNPHHFTLAVYCNEKVKRFQIIPEGTLFRLLDAGTVFNSLFDLVAFYKTHDIIDSQQIIYARLRMLCSKGMEQEKLESAQSKLRSPRSPKSPSKEQDKSGIQSTVSFTNERV